MTNTQKEGIQKLEEALEIIYGYTKEELLGTQLAVFLAVARKEGQEMSELTRYVGRPQGSVSRTVKKMSIYKDSKGNRAGYELLEVRPSYENRRALAVYLSDKGRKLRAEVNKCINDC